LPGFETLGPIDAGGMGVVWRVRDRQFQRPLAVKVMKSVPCDHGSDLRRFLAEARITGQLTHPSIVPVHAMGRLPDGRPYYTMKLVEGKTLAELLRDGPNLPARRMELVQVFAQVCQAVGFAHSRGVIHRDLKPANVMVGEHGEVQVMDWGLAKRLVGADIAAAEAAPALEPLAEVRPDLADGTAAGSVLGTWAYMPPEQARGLVGEVDCRSDVFGLGAILCELLTGQPPYLGSDLGSVPLQAQGARLDGALARLRGCGADAELIRLAEQCLAPNRADRPAHAGEVAAAIVAYQAAVQERLRQAEVEGAAIAARLRAERRTRRVALGLMGLVAVVLLAGLATTLYFFTNAQAEALKARRETALLTWDRGRQLCEAGEVSHGLLLMAQALERAPRGPEDAHLHDALRIELAGWHCLCPTLRQVWKHPDKVLAVAVLDDRTVLTGCADGKVRLWDLNAPDPKGHCFCELAAHQRHVCAVACDQGGTFITGGADGKVYLWKAAGGTAQKIGPLEGEHKGGVCAVALSPDGQWALTGGADETARLWDLRTRTCQILKHWGAVLAVAFSPDNRTFVTGGEKKGRPLPALAASSVSLLGSPAGQGPLLAAPVLFPAAGEVRLYEIRAGQVGEPVFLEDVSKRIRSAAFSPPKGETLLTGDDNWESICWDVKSHKQFAVLAPPGGGDIRGVAFAPDSNTALTGAHLAGLARLWDVSSLRKQWNKRVRDGFLVEDTEDPKPRHQPLRHPGPITAVAFGRDGQHFLTACEDSNVRVWRKAPGLSITVLKHHPREKDRTYGPQREYVVRAVAFHPSGQLAATAGWDGTVQLWKVPTGERDKDPLCHSGRLMYVAFMPGKDSRMVLTAGADGVHFWDLQTRQKVGLPLPHPNHVEATCVSIDPDGDLILIGCDDGSAQLWNAKTRTKIGKPLRHADDRGGVATAISPNKKLFLTASEDGMAKLWDRNGKLSHTLVHQKMVMDVNFSGDSARALTASYDQKVSIWDTATGNLQTTLLHRSDVSSAVFVGDGQRVLTGSRDGAQLWDVQSRRRVGPICWYKDNIMHVALSPDGKMAVLADWDGYGLLWTLPEPKPGDPEQITRWVQAEVGLQLDEGGGHQVLSGPTWLELQKQLPQPGRLP
jgi:WD40 repeat protein